MNTSLPNLSTGSVSARGQHPELRAQNPHHAGRTAAGVWLRRAKRHAGAQGYTVSGLEGTKKGREAITEAAPALAGAAVVSFVLQFILAVGQQLLKGLRLPFLWNDIPP